MSGEENNNREFKVGYKNPPTRTQFQKGQSGNPNGRPRKLKPDAASVAAILDAPVNVRKGGKVTTMSSFDASVRKLVSRAINEGDFRAARKFLELCDQYEVITPAPDPWQNNMLIVPPGRTEAEWLANVAEARAAFLASRT